ncbi:MAG: 4-hydroxythreonine-4-phosphate dehydrogenase PdxA [Bacteroidetes bacterium]|nr:4-hydroxythreonine-4-phosphate dehydrogenase PdxA [Bacteroidota bacterium]
MSELSKPIIGITQGDINGIGPEIVLKALSDHGVLEICTPIFFTSPKTVSYYKRALGIEEFNFQQIRDISQVNSKRINVFVCYEEEVNIEAGKENELGGKYAYISLQKATEALKSKKIDILVTAPINKKNIQQSGFNFIGHTEYLGSELSGEPLMLLCNQDGLRVAVATGHIPIEDVKQKLNAEIISKKIMQLHKSLVEDFAIRKPKIAVLGLNPHASDNGAIGNFDVEVTSKAVKNYSGNAVVFGPYAADGFFGSGTYRQFDAVLAMYHDQGLIPFKTLSFNTGVNFTAGLTAVRTSPDHGVAYDIAGKNKANEQSLREAIYMGIDIFNNRKLYASISSNPLPFQKINIEK